MPIEFGQESRSKNGQLDILERDGTITVNWFLGKISHLETTGGESFPGGRFLY
jgi:hypothetical protein